MRVNPRLHPARDERGAIAVMVAILLVLLLAFAAFALDAGHGWNVRRELITATDAAALGAAGVYATGGNGCAGTAAGLVDDNAPQATMTGCSFTALGPGAGYVTVNAQQHVDYTFGGVIGVSDKTVHSTTTAAFGQPTGVIGLRPLALCNTSSVFAAWLAAGMPTPSAVVTIPYAKDSPADCGATVPGNWGVQDFDGGANSNADTKAWIRDGYDDLVSAPSGVPGDTGAFGNGLGGALDTLVSSGVTFQLPVFDGATGTGSNAVFHVVGFVSVQLVSYKATGAEADRYLQLRFVTAVAQGTCCSHGTDTGTRVIFICAVDPNFPTGNCTDR